MHSLPDEAARLEATERWFAAHGLPYFVLSGQTRARAALRPVRVVPGLVLVVLATVLVGVALAWAGSDVALAPATLLTGAGLAAVGYAVLALGARPIVAWAVGRTFGSLRQLLPTVTRALPLLLVFVTFLFINAEVWQMSASLPAGFLWLTVLLFGAMAVVFLLVRLPEEVDRVDDNVDDALLLSACHGTPLEGDAARLVADETADPTRNVVLNRFERWNLLLVLIVVQGVQVLVVVASMFCFFVLFGALTMRPEVAEAWTGGAVSSVPGLPGLTAELLAVSVFLSAFSGLYFTVVAVTDDTFRGQFFTGVLGELERAIGVRAVYRELLDRRADAPGAVRG
ncbi:hypothetical protein INN71_16375 [Nocardioides sp. ChNu-153]|uniref:hypothetical protein n=1 Tax=unclassified Nocardioides TaxID=2615069 RepID=UPI00240657A8|nr:MULTISPECIES: hypothetical protein [unclassified Nocardioides]MDF9715969.1 hypothetical protein [Nocardioides sp. ChNu-99]MDN7122962.1 hypothetical protein [Nocardioides sp. ChNu-153]